MFDDWGKKLHSKRWHIAIIGVASFVLCVATLGGALGPLGMVSGMVSFWSFGLSYVVWFHGPTRLIEEAPFRYMEWFQVPFMYFWFTLLIMITLLMPIIALKELLASGS